MTASSTYDEPELTTPVALCGSNGLLNRDAVGWSRRPLHTCNLPASLARKKRWNSWAVTSEDLLFSATIADVDRAQTAGVYLFERRSQRHISTGAVVPAGTIVMPEGVGGDIVIDHPRLRVALKDEGTGTRILVDTADFGGTPLHADILVERPPGHQTLNVVIPWSEDVFQYTSKQNTLPASGFVQLADERLDLASPAFGCLDFGRGVWPEQTVWSTAAPSD
jgi:hypothetical protein